MPYYPKHTTRTIPYKEAPCGQINIGKWEPPFAPVPKGHGFVGIVAEDVDSGKLQCHSCGKWFEQLCGHIRKHGMTADYYKKELKEIADKIIAEESKK